MPPDSWLTGKELGMVGDDLDSQAFASPSADVDGFELATLDTLQDSLSRHAEPQPGLEHRHEAGRRFLDKASPQLVGHANAPGRARGELLADDDPGGEPAVQRGRRYSEHLGRFLDRDQLAVRRRGRRDTARDAAIPAQAAHLVGGETLAARGASPLAIEDAGDDAIRVVRGEALNERKAVFIGAKARGIGAREGDVEFGEGAATPAQDDVGAIVVTLDGEGDVFE